MLKAVKAGLKLGGGNCGAVVKLYMPYLSIISPPRF